MDAVEPPTASPEICKLMIACQKNNYEEVKELLDKGVRLMIIDLCTNYMIQLSSC